MRVSRKLGPHASRIIASNQHDVVEGLVEIAQNADLPRVTRELKRLGAHMFGPARPGYVRIEIPGHHLGEVAGVRDILYVEAEDVLHGVGS